MNRCKTNIIIFIRIIIHSRLGKENLQENEYPNACLNADQQYIRVIFTIDETWVHVHRFNPETKKLETCCSSPRKFLVQIVCRKNLRLLG
jgi:hypothetical protein